MHASPPAPKERLRKHKVRCELLHARVAVLALVHEHDRRRGQEELVQPARVGGVGGEDHEGNFGFLAWLSDFDELS